MCYVVGDDEVGTAFSSPRTPAEKANGTRTRIYVVRALHAKVRAIILPLRHDAFANLGSRIRRVQ